MTYMYNVYLLFIYFIYNIITRIQTHPYIFDN